MTRTIIALGLAAMLSPMTANAEALVLACTGMTTAGYDGAPHEPISMGVILDYTTRTVSGFSPPSVPGLLPETPVRIDGANATIISFSGESRPIAGQLIAINGTLDRVTGDVSATQIMSDTNTNKIFSSTTYALKCRPASRQF